MIRSGSTELLEIVFEGMSEGLASEVATTITGFAIAPPSADEGVRGYGIESFSLSPGISLHQVHVRILRYDQDQFDVELNFIVDYRDWPDACILYDAMLRYTEMVASKYRIESRYAGMEPAVDEDTRIFTNGCKGPLYSACAGGGDDWRKRH